MTRGGTPSHRSSRTPRWPGGTPRSMVRRRPPASALTATPRAWCRRDRQTPFSAAAAAARSAPPRAPATRTRSRLLLPTAWAARTRLPTPRRRSGGPRTPRAFVAMAAGWPTSLASSPPRGRRSTTPARWPPSSTSTPRSSTCTQRTTGTGGDHNGHPDHQAPRRHGDVAASRRRPPLHAGRPARNQHRARVGGPGPARGGSQPARGVRCLAAARRRRQRPSRSRRRHRRRVVDAMTSTSDDELANYPYRAHDLESINPSQVREGDLIAGAGPQGSGVFCGKRVTSCGWAGYSTSWKADTYRVETVGPWGESYFVNPDNLPVWRVTEQARARHERDDTDGDG